MMQRLRNIAVIVVLIGMFCFAAWLVGKIISYVGGGKPIYSQSAHAAYTAQYADANDRRIERGQG